MKNIFIWTHSDLDGISSAIVLEWYIKNIHTEYKYKIKTTTPNNFREDFTKWLIYNNISDYDKIYILDLDVSGNIDLIDHKNIVIIDHHEQSNKEAKFKNATALIKIYSSACKLIYTIYSKKYPNIKLSESQKLLILLTDDYDSYTLKFKNSKILNSVLWGLNNKFDTFYNEFKDGYTGFSPHHMGIYKIAENEIQKEIDNIKLWRNKKILIDNKEYDVMSTFVTKHVNEVADILNKKYTPDLLFLINNNHHNISIRGKVENIDEISKNLCDGGGHKYAGGGKLTKQFLLVSKQLEPYDE